MCYVGGLASLLTFGLASTGQQAIKASNTPRDSSLETMLGTGWSLVFESVWRCFFRAGVGMLGGNGCQGDWTNERRLQMDTSYRRLGHCIQACVAND